MKKVITYFKNNLLVKETFKTIFFNTGWLCFDKAVRFLAGMLIFAWTARYLGPSNFGILNYCLAFISLFSVLSNLGIDGIVIREIINNPQSQKETLGSAFFLKFIGGIFAVIASFLVIIVLKPGDRLVWSLVIILSTMYIFQSLDVIDYWFQTKVLSKYVVIARLTAYVIVSMIKIILLIKQAPLIYFGVIMGLEYFIASIALLIVYKLQNQEIKLWRVNFKSMKLLLVNGWPLAISTLFITIYMRIDQILVGNMLGNKSLGIYSAGVTISELWYFIPMAIASSVFPAILYSKKQSEKIYMERLQLYYDFMTWFGIIVAVFFTLFSTLIIGLLYGPEFKEASKVLSILIWTGVSTCLGLASGQYLLSEDKVKISFYRTMIGVILNVFFNLLLIPRLGIVGSAIATFISYTASTFSIGFFGNGKEQFIMLMRTFNLFRILRYISSISKRTEQ